ncbi:MAG: hypothetical protein JXN59_07470 [Anaerolineae bacterium]|nr:hypothetical protein [Anaerolineae bacterium]
MMPATFKPLRGNLRRINLVIAALLLALLIAYVLISFAVGMPPYDYWLLMNGADLFCFQPERFQYGEALNIYYPAPFYSTFCLPYRFAEPALRWAWMLIPPLLALWLARGRAAVLAYPPLGLLLLLGQSTWLALPAFIIGAREDDQRPVRAWTGVLLALGVFKPHVVAPVWAWLAWRWWRRGERRALLVWALAVLLLALPAFLLRPTWPVEWLANGRSAGRVNLANLAMIPLKLGAVEAAPGPGGSVLVAVFCLLAGAGLYGLLRWRRQQVSLYDWVLVYCLASPFVYDYDLIVLLPFVAPHPRRLLLALTVGLVAWLFAMLSGAVSPHYRWSMSLLITLALFAERVIRRDD